MDKNVWISFGSENYLSTLVENGHFAIGPCE
jgi:hypothetical protein